MYMCGKYVKFNFPFYRFG